MLGLLDSRVHLHVPTASAIVLQYLPCKRSFSIATVHTGKLNNLLSTHSCAETDPHFAAGQLACNCCRMLVLLGL